MIRADFAARRTQLLSLLRRHAVLHGSFTLSSGAHSSYYLDARLVTLSAAGSHLVGTLFLDLINGQNVDAVAGLTLGADPIVSSIVTIAGQRGVNVDGLIVRKQTKEHGAGRRIEGPWRAGLRVAIVDDTLTTGASSLQAAEAVVDSGGQVDCVLALIDREQGASDAIANAGYRFHALYRASELLHTP